MRTYNTSLDLVAIAIREFRKGNMTNASVLFAGAAKDPSAGHALKMIDASNREAQRQMAAKLGKPVKAAKKTKPVKASKPVKAKKAQANMDFEDTDPEVLEVLESLTEEEVVEDAEIDFDEELDASDEDGEDDGSDGSDDDEYDDDGDGEGEQVDAKLQAARFVRVLSQFVKPKKQKSR